MPVKISHAIMFTEPHGTPVASCACHEAHSHATVHATLQVVCTIHQPSSDITDMFDDLLLLAQGHVVYHGQWTLAVDYFASLGFQ